MSELRLISDWDGYLDTHEIFSNVVGVFHVAADDARKEIEASVGDHRNLRILRFEVLLLCAVCLAARSQSTLAKSFVAAARAVWSDDRVGNDVRGRAAARGETWKLAENYGSLPVLTDTAPHHCPVCGSGTAQLRYRITRFCVYDCADCSMVYLWPLISEEEVREMFTRLYTSGEGSVPELKSYYDFCYDDAPGNPLVQLYEQWLDKIERYKQSGRILDIGCGAGLFLSVAACWIPGRRPRRRVCVHNCRPPSPRRP